MPRALPNETRMDIVRRHLNGQPLPQIASELRLSQDTVRALWRASRDHGEGGLALRDHACGQATPSTPEPILDAACQLKHDHPTWGAGRIRLELLRDFASAQIPSPRVLQRAFQRAGVNRPRRPQRPKTSLVRALAPHEVWQVDAVEKARLATGEEVSGRTVTDEFSGALLASELSPPTAVASHRARRRPGAVSPRFWPLGTAWWDPHRQRPSLGPELRTTARPGVMAARVGCAPGVDRAGHAAAPWQGRTRQRRDSARGRAVGLPKPDRIAGAVAPRVPDPAGAVPVERRSSANRGVPRAVPERASVPCRRGRRALGPVARGSLPGRTGARSSGQRAGRDLAVWLGPRPGAGPSRQGGLCEV
jgi:hypothetical protein